MARSNGKPGLCVIALRQTQGRGRLGRKWIDEKSECASFTISLNMNPSAERLSTQTALAVCIAAERLLNTPQNTNHPRPAIRWPNDIIIEWRKLAGILIESRDGIACVGIGMNILQKNWPADLTTKAVSLRENDAPRFDRQFVIQTILTAIGEVLVWPDQRLTREYQTRSALLHRCCTFDSAGTQITGVVTDLDPLEGLTVESGAASTQSSVKLTTVHLTAATTSLLTIHNDQEE